MTSTKTTRTTMMTTTMKTTAWSLLAGVLLAAPASATQAPPALQEARAALEAAAPAMAAMRPALAEVRRELAGARAELARVPGLVPAVQVPEPWLQEDPGAELYQDAREALNEGRYGRAADLFSRLRREHPRSGYVADSFYWEAFARYRQGGRDAYQRALELLAVQAERHADARTRADADELRIRVESLLARRGDARAAQAIARQAAGPCDGDQELRAAALSALLNMNADQAVPILREVLASRDECSVELRRRAVFLVSQKMTDESVDILLDLAHRNPDPDLEVREQAVFWLSQARGAEALDALASILQETDDPELQERAVFAISQHGSERAVELLRAYAERPGADREVRANAIFWIGQNGRAGGARYLRELYGRLDDAELKERAIFGVAQHQDAESRRWLLARAGDAGEDMELRKNALFWAGQSGAMGGSELQQLYGSFSDPEMKEQLIFVASQSRDGEAVDFLMDVAREEDDPELREKAIFWLGQSKDPRVAEFLMSLLRG